MKRLIQLPTRDIREKLSYPRKQAWHIKIGPFSLVMIYFAKNYKQLYENYLQGIGVVNINGKFKKYINNRLFRIILLSYISPNNPLNNTQTNFNIISRFLTQLNKKGQKKLISRFRYIQMTIISLEIEQLDQRTNKILKTMIKINSYPQKVIVGPGVEDPVLSNFIVNNNDAYLVDLDNYTNQVNLYYELGYLTKDIQIELHKNFKGIIPNNLDDKVMFNIGKVSRLINLFLNIKNNPNRYYGYNYEEAKLLLFNQCKVLDALLK